MPQVSLSLLGITDVFLLGIPGRYYDRQALSVLTPAPARVALRADINCNCRHISGLYFQLIS